MSKIKTITGSVWLDKLTSPYWRFMGWRAERKLCKLLGQGDIKRGRAVLKKALALDRDAAPL